MKAFFFDIFGTLVDWRLSIIKGIKKNLLSKLLLIDGKTYTMKSNEAIEKIGLLAQEVQKAFPELVKQSGDDEGTLSVNYQGMIPVLINAIKEQQKQIDELKALIQ